MHGVVASARALDDWNGVWEVKLQKAEALNDSEIATHLQGNSSTSAVA